MTRYNNKTYRIDDIDFTTNPRSSFLSDDGDLISFLEYYQNKYGVQVRNLSQPMLINHVEHVNPENPREKTVFVHCLLPEFCYPVYNEW
jgi:aubergine-like protein